MKWQKYDNYDAYNLDRTEYLEEFLGDPEMIEYMLGGGRVGVPITALYKLRNPDGLLKLYGQTQLEGIPSVTIDGKEKYRRLIYVLNPDYIDIIKTISITVTIGGDTDD